MPDRYRQGALLVGIGWDAFCGQQGSNSIPRDAFLHVEPKDPPYQGRFLVIDLVPGSGLAMFHIPIA